MFHENLKALRKDRGLSQEELAVRLNVVRQTISKWEKGLSVPDAAMLIRLAEVLDTTVSRLLGADVPEDEADRDRLQSSWPASMSSWPSATAGAGLFCAWYWASWPPLS